MTEITSVTINTHNHLNCEKVEIIKFNNVFEERFLQTLILQVQDIQNNTSKDTYLTHHTQFDYYGKNIKIIKNKTNDREQNVIFDLMFEDEYRYQTNDTVYTWGKNKLSETVSPVFLKVLHVIENFPPFKDERNVWLPHRLHINYLKNEKFLGLHIDNSPTYFKTKHSVEARQYSFTCYLADHVEGLGGEFWTPEGFVYKPKRNTAILIPGNKFYHGVTQNISDIPRLAFTIRYVHVDDLELPGHPDKFLYRL